MGWYRVYRVWGFCGGKFTGYTLSMHPVSSCCSSTCNPVTRFSAFRDVTEHAKPHTLNPLKIRAERSLPQNPNCPKHFHRKPRSQDLKPKARNSRFRALAPKPVAGLEVCLAPGSELEWEIEAFLYFQELQACGCRPKLSRGFFASSHLSMFMLSGSGFGPEAQTQEGGVRSLLELKGIPVTEKMKRSTAFRVPYYCFYIYSS